MDRRSMLAMAGSIVAGACSGDRCARAGTAPEPSAGALADETWHDVSFPTTDAFPEGQRALVRAEKGSEAWPALIALHGRGEAGRGLAAGAGGWRKDYEIDAAYAALARGTVRPEDAARMLLPEQIARLNASLAEDPFRGLVVACPYTPVPLGRDAGSAEPFASFLFDALFGEVARIRGAPLRAGATGIDGVSMGGRYALQIGFSHPERFASVGGLQPAIQVGEAESFADLAARARSVREQAIQLVSSVEDPFLEATEALVSALQGRKIPVTSIVTKGPHDYAWNRGPGGVVMLAFHERVLRGLAPP